MLTYRKTWGEDRVFFQVDGRLRGVPASWTDVVERPVFVALAAGRAHFRPDDLLRLVELVEGLGARQSPSAPSPQQASGAPPAVSGKLRRVCKKKNAATFGPSRRRRAGK